MTTSNDEPFTTQDCPDDAPDGTCWYCGAPKSERHRSGCLIREPDLSFLDEERL